LLGGFVTILICRCHFDFKFDGVLPRRMISPDSCNTGVVGWYPAPQPPGKILTSF